MRTVLIAAALLGSATAAASPPPEPEVTSYRAQTLAADAVGIALLIAGGLAEGEDGSDTKLSERLMAGGLITVSFGAPFVHLFNGERGRGGNSLLMRWGLAGAGMLVAVAARSGCGDSPPDDQGLDDAFCHLDYLGYGMIGGFVVASLLDAAFMTDRRAKPPTWTPRVTASRDGVGVGASWRW